MPPFTIVIAGAGLSGLCLAHVLLSSTAAKEGNLHVIVLERDSSESARNQGIVIGLRQEGVDVLKRCGMDDALLQMLAKGNVGATDLALLSQTGRILIKGYGFMTVVLRDGSTRSSLIDRAELRQRMLQQVMTEVNATQHLTMKFDARVNLVSQEQDGTISVTLENGEMIHGNVLVGADGARSVVRSICCPEWNPEGLGIYNTTGTIDNVSTKFKRGGSNHFFNVASTSLTRISGKEGHTLMMFVSSTDMLLWSYSFPGTEANRPLIAQPPLPMAEHINMACDMLRATFSSHAGLTEIVAASTRVGPAYEMFSVTNLKIFKTATCSSKGFTHVALMGDSAHKTTTQAGVGATAALLDAEDLAHTLLTAVNKEQSVENAIVQYEKRLAGRAALYVGQSLGNTRIIHTKHGYVGELMTTSFMWCVGCIISGVTTITGMFRAMKRMIVG